MTEKELLAARLKEIDTIAAALSRLEATFDDDADGAWSAATGKVKAGCETLVLAFLNAAAEEKR